ncbi:20934_t:CDS:10, partial [Dentiscutata erythropus]
MLQEPKQIKVPSIAISDLSKYHQFNCDKLLRNTLDEDYERRRSTTNSEKKFSEIKINNSTLRDAVKSRGGDFEAKVVEDLEKRVKVVDCTSDDPSKALITLQNAKVGEVLYQLKFDVPDDLYDHLKIKDIVRLKSFIPDFIEIVGEGGKKRLLILDAKSSKGTRVSHQFQVAAYTYLLKHITKDIPDISVSKFGGIYLPKKGGFELQTFRTELLLSKVEKFLSTDLRDIASASEVSWHYNSRCKTCAFVDDCRVDAKGSMSMIPYLSTDNANDLRLFVKNTWNKEKRYKKDAEIENLAKLFTIDDNELNDHVNKLVTMTPNDYLTNPKIVPLIKHDKVNETDIEDLANNFSKLSVKIEDLADCIDKLSIDDDEKVMVNEVTATRRIKQIIKYDKDRKKSPYIEAFKTEKAQFIGTPTANFPQRTDHNLVLTMSIDPFVLLPFGWSMSLYAKDGQVMKKFQFAESVPKYKDENQSAFVSLMDKFVTRLTKIFEYLSNKKSRACIFVYSEQEKFIIQESLLKIIRLDDISEAIQHMTTRCLYNLFEDCSLLLAVGSDVENSSEIPGEWREFPRLVILEQSLSENVAICVPGFYRFIDIWEQMVKPTLEDNKELLTTLEPEISKIDLEDIYATWISENGNENEINKYHLLRAVFVNVVIQAFYALVKKSTDDISSKLLFSPPAFVFSEIRSFINNYLGKLYFFKQFEGAMTYYRTKAVRQKDLVLGETKCGLRVKADRFLKKDEKSVWILQCIVLNCENEFHVLEPSSMKEFILVEDTAEGILEAIRFSDMEYKDKQFGYPLNVLSLVSIDDTDPAHRVIQLKGTIKKSISVGTTYRLYKRFVDFNTDKILKMLIEIDEQPSSIFLDLLSDPNAWGSSLSEEHTYPKELKDTALELRDSFSMSPSQKEIAAVILEKRMQIVWGPPGSGKTHFLALFVTWYLSTLKPKPTENNKNFMIGVTAFTRSAIDNLLERIATVQKEGNKIDDFTIVRMVKESNNSIDNINDCKAENLPKKILGAKLGTPGKPLVVGGTVWDWYKIRKEFNGSWTGCNIMIIDEGSQLLVSDASIALECLNQNSGKLIIAGDHMQLGPIIQNTYPIYGDNHPLIFGSIQQCLMRKEDGSIFNENPFLEKGQKHDFGPCTLQLRDNWRMNGELNNFFQKIYGEDYISKQPDLKLNFEDDKLLHIDNPDIRKILSPETAIALVKLSLKNNDQGSSQPNISGLLSEKVLHAEADVVAKIVTAYFDSPRKPDPQHRKPSLFIVTPHHRQRQAVQSRLNNYLSSPKYNLKINTVEKMQGQEADLVIACFVFLDQNEIVRESDFLFDRNRWNVAISRARCKIVLLTTHEMLYPKSMDIFFQKKSSEGWVYLSMIETWVKKRYGGKNKRKDKKNLGIIEWKIDGNQTES